MAIAVPLVWPRPNKLLKHNKSTALIVSQHGQSFRWQHDVVKKNLFNAQNKLQLKPFHQTWYH